MRRISIVINKNWEAEPAISAMVSTTIRPKGFIFPTWLNSPKDGSNKMSSPRAIYMMTDGPTPLQVSVWCLQDLMNPAKSSSSSEEKYNVLPKVLSTEKPDLVIAVGTACYPDEKVTNNGKVFVGGQFFLHNGHPDNPDSNFHTDLFDKLIPKNVATSLFDLMSPAWRTSTALNFLPVPNKPGSPEVVIDQDFVSVGDLNITNYDEYPAADPVALQTFADLQTGFTTPSLETTHGIIRLSSNTPTIFVSGIVNRMTMLKQEATLTQNYAGAFNTGVVLANLIQLINESSLTTLGQ